MVQTITPVKRIDRSQSFPNSLEPVGLVEAFFAHPPEGFGVHRLETAAGFAPSFASNFDIMTTLDDEESKLTRVLRDSDFLRFFTTVPALFVGTTVSEYSLYPERHQQELIQKILHQAKICKSQLVIIKDIPSRSPLLSDAANEAADRLLKECRKAGFVALAGQALAYVPIDFKTIDEYFSTKLSYSRRKEFKKKLKARALVEAENIRTGDSRFSDPELLSTLYRLYLNVFEQSKYHFDKLSRQFFDRVFQDAESNGVVFIYKRDGKIIAFNLCYVHNGYLVDKYVGFAYPDAREVNLYFVSWFTNLEFALAQGLTHYVAGWTDPEVKTALGASFTFTQHAVFARNFILRFILNKFQRFFEPDANWADRVQSSD